MENSCTFDTDIFAYSHRGSSSSSSDLLSDSFLAPSVTSLVSSSESSSLWSVAPEQVRHLKQKVVLISKKKPFSNSHDYFPRKGSFLHFPKKVIFFVERERCETHLGFAASSSFPLRVRSPTLKRCLTPGLPGRVAM